MLAELEAGATTYDQIYGPLGLDWKQQFEALKQQREYAAKIGLTLGEQPKEEEPEDDQIQKEDEEYAQMAGN